jgi:PII-like signaling protein
LMIYTSESARHGGVPIHRALLQRLRERQTPDGATALRGVWGFHGDHPPHGDRLLSLSRRVPVVTIVVDTPANIAESFDVVDELTRDEGLVTSEMVPALVSDEGDNGSGRPPLARLRY